MESKESTDRCPPCLDGKQLWTHHQKPSRCGKIVRRYPNQWVLVEETAWDPHRHPTAGMVRAASVTRGDLREPVRRCHHDRAVTTFLFYTGEPISTDLTVVL